MLTDYTVTLRGLDWGKTFSVFFLNQQQNCFLQILKSHLVLLLLSVWGVHESLWIMEICIYLFWFDTQLLTEI